MNKNIRRAFRTTKIKIDKATLASDDQRQALESMFLTMTVHKTDAVAAERTAGIAAAKAKVKASEAQVAEFEFLNAASQYFDAVAGERMWVIYRDSDGVVTLEGFTERLIRNTIRAQQQLLGDQVSNTSDDDVERDDLYESGEDADPEN